MDDRLSYWFDGGYQPDRHVPVRVLVEQDVFCDMHAYDRVLNHLAYLGFHNSVEVAYDPQDRADGWRAIYETAVEFATTATAEWTSFYSYGNKAVVLCFREERDAFTFRLFFG